MMEETTQALLVGGPANGQWVTINGALPIRYADPGREAVEYVRRKIDTKGSLGVIEVWIHGDVSPDEALRTYLHAQGAA